MSAMCFLVALVVTAFAAVSLGARSTMLDLNPALGVYQDDRDCFPFKTRMHQIYRNFKNDSLLGGEAKCVSAGPTGPLINSQVQSPFQYGSDGLLEATITLVSSPGYTVGNVLEIAPQDGSAPPVNLTVAYRDCKTCKVFRHDYVDNGNGCSYWVTDEALGEDTTCCEFVYKLLCGTSPLYKMYDKSCQ
uniref:Putative lipocalin-2 1 n=1 Tax=Amblyomma triste TaxID=251400 RepID=A0A023GDQ4_AMBTT